MVDPKDLPVWIGSTAGFGCVPMRDWVERACPFRFCSPTAAAEPNPWGAALPSAWFLAANASWGLLRVHRQLSGAHLGAPGALPGALATPVQTPRDPGVPTGHPRRCKRKMCQNHCTVNSFFRDRGFCLMFFSTFLGTSCMECTLLRP